MRTGKKRSSEHLVGYHTIEGGSEKRFGFVVSKACGGAVKRNKIKRRLRALARERMVEFQPGIQLVIRSLPGSAELSFSDLELEFEQVSSLK
jgi:ribonuclease P protein component